MKPALVATAAAELAPVAAEVIADALAGARSVAFSGGTTPAATLHALATLAGVDWPRIEVFQVDERVAPAGHPDRNLTMLDAMLLNGVEPHHVHPMPVDAPDLDAAAAAYAGTLPHTLDVVVLGLGDDGHTASLLPGDPVLAVTDRDVAMTGPYRGHVRMTLTHPALDRARRVIWLVQGATKRAALDRLRSGDRTIPAGNVRPDRALVVADHDAAGTTGTG